MSVSSRPSPANYQSSIINYQLHILLLLLLPSFALAQMPGAAVVLAIYGAPPAVQEGRLPGATRGLMWSADTGETWKGAGLPTYRVNDVLRTPAGALVQATDEGVLRSGDGGGAWRLVTDWTALPALALATAGDELWAATAGGPLRSTDDGRTWAYALTGLPGPEAADIASLCARGDTVFAATSDGVYAWTNGAWRPAGLQGARLDGVASNGDRIAAFGADSSLWFAAGADRRWTKSALRPHLVQAVVFPTGPRNAILAATRDAGVFRSDDGGATWTPAGGMPTPNVTALAADPAHPDILYAGTENGAFVSRNGGRAWQATTMRIGYVSAIRVFSNEVGR